MLLAHQVQRVCLGNDTRGRGRGVFVEEIEIAAPNEEPVMFPCRCWLAEDEGDGKTARVLQPGETFQPQYDSKSTKSILSYPYICLYSCSPLLHCCLKLFCSYVPSW